MLASRRFLKFDRVERASAERLERDSISRTRSLRLVICKGGQGSGALTLIRVDLMGGQVLIRNNPVLNWNASCLALQSDRKDNVLPAKPERGKSNKRIDGISAIITALNRAATAVVPKKQSVYERRGMRFI